MTRSGAGWNTASSVGVLSTGPEPAVAGLGAWTGVEPAGAPCLNGATEQAESAGALGADYYGYHGPTGERLEDGGMIPVSRVGDGGALPSRFQPIDGKGGGIMSAMLVQFDRPACVAGAACPWYWTKADSDQDRPN